MNLPLDIAMPAEASAAPKTYRLLIDGKFVDARDGRTLERESPGHGFTVSRYAQAGAAEVEAAVTAAHKAFEAGPWPRMKAGERAAILLKAADLIEARLEEIARLDALESGKPIAQARGEIGGAVDIWRYAASLARTLHGETYANLGDAMLGVVLREPIGVVSIITPWNFPFLIVSQKLPFALAAGCTAVVKPSEMTSASTFVLGDILMQAGLPDGVVNILAGLGADVGAAMVSHPLVEMVSFTGSTRVGKMTMGSAASTLKKVSMELGGVYSGGKQIASSAGQYLDPTILRGVTEDMAIAREEVFGPVLSVLTFESIEKALRIANNTPYGLSAGVWSASIDTCMSVARNVRSGTVWVNTFMEGYPELPFGGYKQSGLGRELGKRAVEDYTEEKTIQFHRGQRTGWWVG
ncbi:MAG: aldehyde dehydrogenase family protein [Mesorhizobium sp.]|nr:MAG: aldehyde dehydrogenase family protein [Mesorhizobium sp.]